MRVLRADGTSYVVLEANEQRCRVRRLDTGALDTLRPATLSDARGVDTPEAIAAAVAPEQAERAHALLAELDARGPTPVRTLLAESDLCESDLHGLVSELRLASLLEKTTVAGEPGYQSTQIAQEALEGPDGQSRP